MVEIARMRFDATCSCTSAESIAATNTGVADTGGIGA